LRLCLGLLAAACGGGGGRSDSQGELPALRAGRHDRAFGNTGQPLLSACKGYADYTNNHDGVKGHKLVLTSLDDAGDPSSARVDFQQAVNGGALAVLGVNDSNAWSPSASLLQQKQIPTLELESTDLKRGSD
jgi:ABC-type branched-subunit amino acid transport system substrate-binding protein